jgi:pimeloyl-ACP methyl ester carboxylesterase
MGGLLALDATVAHPDRVQGLVLVAPAVRGMPDEDSIEPPPAILELFEQFEAAEAAADTERQNQLDARYWLDGPLEPEGRVAGEARRLFLDMNARALAAAPVGDEAEGAAVWGRLGEIAVPTLVLWGDLDEPWTGDVCRSLAGAIPGAIARELHGTAHLPGLEQPAALAAVVADFVTTHTAGGRP